MFAGLILFFTGCVDEKDLYDPDREFPNPIEEITVPADFDWKTMSTIKLKVIVDDKFNDQYSYAVEIFDSNPVLNKNAKQISLGYAKKSKAFETVITVPAGIHSLYLKQTGPDGLSSVMAGDIAGKTSMICDFSGKGISSTRNAAGSVRAVPEITKPESPVVDPEDENLFPTNVPDDAKVLTGGSWQASGNYIINSQTTQINVAENSVLYVTENAEITSVNGVQNRKFYILPGKRLTIKTSLNLGQPNCLLTIPANSELIVEGELKTGKNNRLYNLGSVKADKLHLVESSVLYNAGRFNIAGLCHIDNKSLYYNVNEAIIGGNLHATQAGEIYNNSNIEITGIVSLQSGGNKLYNDGEILSTGFTSTGASVTQNNNELTVNGLTSLDGSSNWVNNGLWTTENALFNSSTMYNVCKLIVRATLDINSKIQFVNDKGSYVQAQDFFMRTESRIEMYSQSFINILGTASFRSNPVAQGYGFYGMASSAAESALLKMGEMKNLANWHVVSYNGNIQILCPNHPERIINYNEIYTENGVTWAQDDKGTVTIPEGECSEEWNTKPEEPEEPEIKDNVDPFTYNYLFEDMWPFYGDYDMNDVVLRIKNITYYAVTKDNKTSKFSFDASPRASGAEKRIASALMLDNIQASGVKSVSYSSNAPTTYNVSGSGIEQNQTNAVVPLFDEVHKFIIGRDGAWYINTKPNTKDNVANPPTMTVTVEFNNPVDMADLNVKFLNFFIITDIDHPNKSVKNNPRREIHLVDYKNTSMGETSFFGNNNDDSSISAGRYYRSKDNLPWAIVIPDEFKWPVETIKIQNAYKEFEDWVTSEGASNTEWYKNPVSGTVYELN